MSFDLTTHLLAQAVSDEQHKKDLEIAEMLAAMDDEYGDDPDVGPSHEERFERAEWKRLISED